MPRNFRCSPILRFKDMHRVPGSHRPTASGFGRRGVPDGRLVAQLERQVRDVIEL